MLALCVFSSFVSAFIFVNPAILSGVILASVPPAITISWYPCLIILYPSPILCVPDAHAVTIAIDSPFAPKSIATFPVAIFDIPIGIYIGDTLSGPLFTHFSCSVSIVSIPPIPDPIIVPTLSMFSFSLSNPLSFHACLEATIAYCENKSSLFASLLSK